MQNEQAARGCLDDDEIVALVAGDCDEATRGVLLGHAIVCDSCHRLVGGAARALRSHDDDDDIARELPRSIGRYRVCRELGRGGMGVVYEAIDPRLDRRVAIKQLRAGILDSHADRLQAEARTLARLSHPNVVVVFEAGADHVVMELIDGEPLHRKQCGLPWRDILRYYLEAARGLAAAHAVGVVHRDFKPHNVLVGDDGRVRVADFGLAAVRTPTDAGLDSDEAATSSGLAGTPAYMAPERFIGHPADAASDQFSFCVALFEALAGVRPFPGDDVAAIASAVLAGDLRRRPAVKVPIPGGIWRAVERGLRVEPERRWPAMTALVDALEVASRRRRARPLVAAAIVCAGAIGAMAADRPDVPALCRSDDDGLEVVWNPDRARTIERALVDSGVDYGAGMAITTIGYLDAYASEWTAARAELCAAPTAMEASAACLEDRRALIADVVERLGQGEPEAALAAPRAASRLSGARACLDRPRLGPPSPAARELGRELARERVTLALGAAEADLQRIELLVSRTDALGDPVLAAEARLVQGTALGARALWDEGIVALEDAYFRAYENGDDAMVSDAARNLALGTQWLGRHTDALEWCRRARASAVDAVQRADVAGVE
ncbi:MAG TPA: serine/threonine-protein kinase, partial [Nannocystaceae bacterium]|nr:serine/threonine-protein kinase [Nannocystaceae bacterium]